ncbi:MAG: hypothetical protein OXR72_04545 [Gemmatimonadota bacterium]|nr:hypothetical protein [Gemmatimonadota bacterium]
MPVLKMSGCPLLLIKDIATISLFATSGAFIISTGVDAMFGLAESISKAKFERGRQEGIREAWQKIFEWVESEKQSGTQFKSDPPMFNGQDVPENE